MCLGVPAEVKSVDGPAGIARVGSLETPVNLQLTPEARPGDYVMLHAGFAIKVMDKAAVIDTLEVLGAAGSGLERLERLERQLAVVASGLPPVRLMEVCGTHTVAIARAGLKGRLPKNIGLISGPGCPVCVTPPGEIDMAVDLALSRRAHIVSFGDMLRVPGSDISLEAARARGAKVSVVYSPAQALEMARRQSEAVVFLAVGFETTAPVIATVVGAAVAEGLSNFSVLVSHRLIPPALQAILSNPEARLDGLICPGHVSTVIGSEAYTATAKEHHIPCVVAGFEPVDILEAVLMLVERIAAGRAGVGNQYKRTVSSKGSPAAKLAIAQAFETVDGDWRGLGTIEKSALKLRPRLAAFDAVIKYNLKNQVVPEPKGCRCGGVLSGRAQPSECRLFGRACLPDSPVGPCMVSSEGACAAAYVYGGAREQ